MLTFKHFYLNEASKDVDPSKKHIYSPTPLHDDEALVDWCEDHAPNYLKGILKNAIYRGMSTTGPGLIDTNKFDRKSANTFNYYTIWMDNNSQWAAYPKRSKSLICSTNWTVTDGFGQLKIGNCPDDDLCGAFGHLTSMLTDVQGHMDLSDFTSVVHTIIMHLYGKADDTQAQTNFGELPYVLKRLTAERLENAHANAFGSSLLEYQRKQLGVMTDVLQDRQFKSMYELFVEGFDPEKNGFKVVEAGSGDDYIKKGDSQTLLNFVEKYNIPMHKD